MKTRNIYLIVVIVIFVIALVAESNAPVPINWMPTYSSYDKIPYGDYVVYDALPDLFPGKKITVSEKPLYTALADSMVNTNFLIIDNYFDLDSLEAMKLLSYVYRGNNAFIASCYFSGFLSDSLKISTKYGNTRLGKYFSGRGSRYHYQNNQYNYDSITLSLLDSTDQVFAYKPGTVQDYFKDDTEDNSADDSTDDESDDSIVIEKKVLSKNSNDKDVFISVKFGKGTFFLSSVPTAFTNYNMLNDNNSEYISRCLSYLPVADTYWDEHYKSVSHKASTPLRYILGSVPLRYAYYIMISGLLLYVIFEGKRRQRIVPVIKPLKNTSLDFTETIGLLYYEKGNNIGIAKKRISYLFDTIRSRYRINTDESNPYFFSDLSSKTLIKIEDLVEIFKFIRYVEGQNFLTSQSLLQLNTLIENFYKQTQ